MFKVLTNGDIDFPILALPADLPVTSVQYPGYWGFCFLRGKAIKNHVSDGAGL